MVVTLKSYLQGLQGLEARRPPEKRRDVPTLEELATAAGIHPVTLSNIANNKTKRLTLDVIGSIIVHMRSKGFHMRTTDFLDFQENGEEEALESSEEVQA